MAEGKPLASPLPWPINRTVTGDLTHRHENTFFFFFYPSRPDLVMDYFFEISSFLQMDKHKQDKQTEKLNETQTWDTPVAGLYLRNVLAPS